MPARNESGRSILTNWLIGASVSALALSAVMGGHESSSDAAEQVKSIASDLARTAIEQYEVNPKDEQWEVTDSTLKFSSEDGFITLQFEDDADDGHYNPQDVTDVLVVQKAGQTNYLVSVWPDEHTVNFGYEDANDKGLTYVYDGSDAGHRTTDDNAVEEVLSSAELGSFTAQADRVVSDMLNGTVSVEVPPAHFVEG